MFSARGQGSQSLVEANERSSRFAATRGRYTGYRAKGAKYTSCPILRGEKFPALKDAGLSMPEGSFKHPFQGKEADVVDVPIVEMSEKISNYELGDGTRIAVRPVVAAVMRVLNEYDNEGNPQYLVKSQIVVSATQVPAELRRKIG